MSNSADLADYEWLVCPEAETVLRDLVAARAPLHALAARLRKQFSAARVHLLLETVELRERAAVKFAHADRMFFTRLGLEQATDEWVARYKSQRVAGRVPVADLCCGIGGDLLALAEQGGTVGIDRDPIAICLAAANSRAVLPTDTVHRLSFQTTNIDHLNACGLTAWHIDPDRRPSGKRTSSLEWSSPSLPTVDRLLADSPNAAIKLAPAADAPETWRERCELEWISRDRQCRQQVAWHGDLAHPPGQRRATVLAVDGEMRRTLTGSDEGPLPVAKQLDRFLHEPDPAVLAAHLTGSLAAEHNLSAVAYRIEYLTGPIAIDDPALACFEIDEVLPLKLTVIAELLRHRGIGQLEIKKRGVDHDPQTVRKQLKLTGSKSATLFLTKLNGKHAAILAHRAITPINAAAKCLSLSPVP